MINRTLATIYSISALALITACSSGPRNVESYPGAYNTSSSAVQYGNVSNIEVVSSGTRGAGGAVLGAVIGAVIGNQIGRGTGRAAATGLGAVGGAVIGNNLQKRNETDVYRVSVRWDSGNMGQFDYHSIEDLRVGDRVRVDGGQLHRVG